jgi:hypothetical protein
LAEVIADGCEYGGNAVALAMMAEKTAAHSMLGFKVTYYRITAPRGAVHTKNSQNFRMTKLVGQQRHTPTDRIVLSHLFK